MIGWNLNCLLDILNTIVKETSEIYLILFIVYFFDISHLTTALLSFGNETTKFG